MYSYLIGMVVELKKAYPYMHLNSYYLTSLDVEVWEKRLTLIGCQIDVMKVMSC